MDSFLNSLISSEPREDKVLEASYEEPYVFLTFSECLQDGHVMKNNWMVYPCTLMNK